MLKDRQRCNSRDAVKLSNKAIAPIGAGGPIKSDIGLCKQQNTLLSVGNKTQGTSNIQKTFSQNAINNRSSSAARKNQSGNNLKNNTNGTRSQGQYNTQVRNDPESKEKFKKFQKDQISLNLKSNNMITSSFQKNNKQVNQVDTPLDTNYSSSSLYQSHYQQKQSQNRSVSGQNTNVQTAQATGIQPNQSEANVQSMRSSKMSHGQQSAQNIYSKQNVSGVTSTVPFKTQRYHQKNQSQVSGNYNLVSQVYNNQLKRPQPAIMKNSKVRIVNPSQVRQIDNKKEQTKNTQATSISSHNLQGSLYKSKEESLNVLGDEKILLKKTMRNFDNNGQHFNNSQNVSLKRLDRESRISRGEKLLEQVNRNKYKNSQNLTGNTSTNILDSTKSVDMSKNDGANIRTESSCQKDSTSLSHYKRSGYPQISTGKRSKEAENSKIMSHMMQGKSLKLTQSTQKINNQKEYQKLMISHRSSRQRNGNMRKDNNQIDEEAPQKIIRTQRNFNDQISIKQMASITPLVDCSSKSLKSLRSLRSLKSLKSANTGEKQTEEPKQEIEINKMFFDQKEDGSDYEDALRNQETLGYTGPKDTQNTAEFEKVLHEISFDNQQNKQRIKVIPQDKRRFTEQVADYSPFQNQLKVQVLKDQRSSSLKQDYLQNTETIILREEDTPATAADARKINKNIIKRNAQQKAELMQTSPDKLQLFIQNERNTGNFEQVDTQSLNHSHKSLKSEKIQSTTKKIQKSTKQKSRLDCKSDEYITSTVKRIKLKSPQKSPTREPTMKQNQLSMILMQKQMDIMQQRIHALENENIKLKDMNNQKDQRIFMLEQICHNQETSFKSPLVVSPLGHNPLEKVNQQQPCSIVINQRVFSEKQIRNSLQTRDQFLRSRDNISLDDNNDMITIKNQRKSLVLSSGNQSGYANGRKLQNPIIGQIKNELVQIPPEITNQKFPQIISKQFPDHMKQQQARSRASSGSNFQHRLQAYSVERMPNKLLQQQQRLPLTQQCSFENAQQMRNAGQRSNQHQFINIKIDGVEAINAQNKQLLVEHREQQIENQEEGVMNRRKSRGRKKSQARRQLNQTEGDLSYQYYLNETQDFDNTMVYSGFGEPHVLSQDGQLDRNQNIGSVNATIDYADQNGIVHNDESYQILNNSLGGSMISKGIINQTSIESYQYQLKQSKVIEDQQIKVRKSSSKKKGKYDEVDYVLQNSDQKQQSTVKKQKVQGFESRLSKNQRNEKTGQKSQFDLTFSGQMHQNSHENTKQKTKILTNTDQKNKTKTGVVSTRKQVLRPILPTTQPSKPINNLMKNKPSTDQSQKPDDQNYNNVYNYQDDQSYKSINYYQQVEDNQQSQSTKDAHVRNLKQLANQSNIQKMSSVGPYVAFNRDHHSLSSNSNSSFHNILSDQDYQAVNYDQQVDLASKSHNINDFRTGHFNQLDQMNQYLNKRNSESLYQSNQPPIQEVFQQKLEYHGMSGNEIKELQTNIVLQKFNKTNEGPLVLPNQQKPKPWSQAQHRRRSSKNRIVTAKIPGINQNEQNKSYDGRNSHGEIFSQKSGSEGAMRRSLVEFKNLEKQLTNHNQINAAKNLLKPMVIHDQLDLITDEKENQDQNIDESISPLATFGNLNFNAEDQGSVADNKSMNQTLSMLSNEGQSQISKNNYPKNSKLNKKRFPKDFFQQQN